MKGPLELDGALSKLPGLVCLTGTLGWALPGSKELGYRLSNLSEAAKWHLSVGESEPTWKVRARHCAYRHEGHLG
jgi:hypothetical protein